jgi:hypothetical protein
MTNAMADAHPGRGGLEVATPCGDLVTRAARAIWGVRDAVSLTPAPSAARAPRPCTSFDSRGAKVDAAIYGACAILRMRR